MIMVASLFIPPLSNLFFFCLQTLSLVSNFKLLPGFTTITHQTFPIFLHIFFYFYLKYKNDNRERGFNLPITMSHQVEAIDTRWNLALKFGGTTDSNTSVLLNQLEVYPNASDGRLIFFILIFFLPSKHEISILHTLSVNYRCFRSVCFHNDIRLGDYNSLQTSKHFSLKPTVKRLRKFCFASRGLLLNMFLSL